MRFHDTGIGNTDEDYWIRCMKAKAWEIYDEYVVKFRAWTEYEARLAANSGDISLDDSTVHSQSVQGEYDPPIVNNALDNANNYLAQQNINTFDQRSQGGLEPETVRQYMDAVRDPFEEWATRFDKLFYWGI